jgi:hypothetical protein
MLSTKELPYPYFYIVFSIKVSTFLKRKQMTTLGE